MNEMLRKFLRLLTCLELFSFLSIPFLQCNTLSSMQHLSQHFFKPVVLLKLLVRLTRLELVQPKLSVPKTDVSANSTIGASILYGKITDNIFLSISLIIYLFLLLCPINEDLRSSSPSNSSSLI